MLSHVYLLRRYPFDIVKILEKLRIFIASQVSGLSNIVIEKMIPTGRDIFFISYNNFSIVYVIFFLLYLGLSLFLSLFPLHLQ